MKKIRLFAGTAALLLLSSCMGCAVPSDSAATNPPVLTAVAAGSGEADAPGASSPATKTVTAGTNDFALRLTAALLGEGAGNQVLSPYSVWLPLAALMNGTEGEGGEALAAALGAAGISSQDINRAAARMLYDLTQTDARLAAERVGETVTNPLRIANALFLSREKAASSAFAEAFASYYQGQTFQVDFTSPQAADAVNQWAAEATEGLIPEIIDSFDPETLAAIANAIYFSDRWKQEFDPAATETGIFHGSRGDSDAAFMVRKGDGQYYCADASLQALRLPFTTGASLLVLLPEDGDARGLLEGMTAASFDTLLGSLSPSSGTFKMPRFSADSGLLTLNDALTALGVPLFDPDAPVLTKLLADGTETYIRKAVQKSVLQVDERGTTAAAVTVMAIEAAGLAAPSEEPFTMVCDRPFAYILYDNTADGPVILFTGVTETTEP